MYRRYRRSLPQGFSSNDRSPKIRFGGRSFGAAVQAIALLVMVVCSQKAWALVGASFNFGIGQSVDLEVKQDSWKKLEEERVTATYFKLSVFGSPPIPTPLIDLNIGLGIGYENYDLGNPSFDLEHDGDQIVGTLGSLKNPFIGPELSVDVIIPGISIGPRGRILYAWGLPSLEGTYKIGDDDKKTVKVPLTSKSLHYAAGIVISPVPFVSVFIEHEWAKNTVSLSSTLKTVKNIASSVKGKTLKLSDDISVEDFDMTLRRKGFIIGVQAGI